MGKLKTLEIKTGVRAAFLVSFIAFLVYLPALHNGFVNWDDDGYVYNNLNIRNLNAEFFISGLTRAVGALWHPLTMYSLSLDYLVWGLNPLGYHLTNIFLHAINTFLVFLLILRLAECVISEPINQTAHFPHKRALVTASVASFLFGIHPMHVESVAWISERKDVLYAAFFLLTIITYIKYISGGPKQRRFYLLSIVLFMLSLTSKPMAVSLPLVLLILDHYPFRRFEREGVKCLLIEKLPFFLLSVLTALATIWAQQSEGAMADTGDAPMALRILVAAHAYVFYLVKMLFPISLAPLYPYPPASDLSAPRYAGSLLLFFLLSIFCLFSFKKHRILFVLWAYFLVSLVPVVGLVQVGNQAAADRYTYLPSLGPFILIGICGAKVYESQHSVRRRHVAVVSLMIIAAAMCYISVRQIRIWKDSITLWSHEIKLFPKGQSISYNNLGIAYIEKGDHRRGIEEFTKAIKISPKMSDAYFNRGLAYNYLGNFKDAIADFNRALTLNPNTKAYYNRGMAYFGAGDYKNAISDYNRVIELNPKSANAYYNRGLVYSDIGSYALAIKDYSAAIGLDSRDARSYNNRGRAYFEAGDIGMAIKDLSRAVEIDPNYARAYFNLGIIHSRIGDAEKGLFYVKKAEALGYEMANFGRK